MKIIKENIQDLRQEYKNASLNEIDVLKNPIEQFKSWFSDAIDADVYEPNVMTLATADKKGRVSARIVLLKDVNANGFTFYTNYNSDKSKAITENNQVALVFFWADLERQVRIEGKAQKVPEEVSNAYFYSRPKTSQIGALVSDQSSSIENRKTLEDKFKELYEKFVIEDVPKPKHWGGFIVEPQRIEFWQGRPGRLHDRLNFEKNVNGDWEMNRLAP